MEKYFISKLIVKKLWGDKDKVFDLDLDPNMNIIIGRNATGKTTLINLLHYALTANIFALSQIEFSEIIVSLQCFDSDKKKKLSVTQTEEKTEFSFDNHVAYVPMEEVRLLSMQSEVSMYRNRRRILYGIQNIREALAECVPAVWLPVSRRLPIAEEEDAERRRLHRKPLESVDECLDGLLISLQSYRVMLDVQLSELRKEFQKHALETILYDKQHDKYTDFRAFISPSDEEKNQLLQAFTDVGLLDLKIKKRIDEHFKAATNARSIIEKASKNDESIDFDTFLIIPLMNRTKSMVTFARELEEKRTKLFSSLHTYESVVSDFLEDKKVEVLNSGQLQVTKKNRTKDQIDWRNLSSGEKQIFILLTQALLWERDPVIYVADEPELSLHVIWQEKLMTSLKNLAGRCQFIIATHSPDIAGGFQNNIINLGKK